jgi:hypothetical protein
MIVDFSQELANFIQTEPAVIQIVAGAILALIVLFLLRFVLPAVWIWFRLRGVVHRLRRLRKSKDRNPASIFARSRTLSHLWTEYEDTLHEQRLLDTGTGTLKPAVLRSTVPAAMVFTTDTLVDSRLAAEFFKHLPGLFTGVGIIGTFFGLIHGLQAFRISEEAAVVRTSLEGLMQGVSAAFIVSASAIAAAMLTTFIEKSLITALYRKVEDIIFELDGMFESGAGEEYLARLVKASEDAADQSKILKDALVSDLGRILSDLTQQQIRAQTQGSQELAKQFVESLTVGLQGPLERIAESFQNTSQVNSDAVTRLLTDVLAAFGQRLEELFGDQITGINQLQQQTIHALQAAVVKLDQMASSVEAAGNRTSEAMGQRLADAISAMESRQNVMNERMTEFVEQLRRLVRDSQTETNHKLQTTLAEIGEAVQMQISVLKEQSDQASASHSEREGRIATQTQEMLRQLSSQLDAAVGSLRAQSEQSATAQVEREQRMAAQADETVAKLASLTESLMAEIRAIASEVRSSVEAMRIVTSDVVTRMNSGAETMYLAADEFSKAGQGVAGVLQQATGISNRLADAATSVSASSTMLQGVVVDYAMTRETLAAMLADLRSTVENAKREANLTSDILARIESASQKLGQAQKDAEEYLGGISEVLANAHAEFAEGLKRVIGESYREFYDRLSTATVLLRQAIEELAATVEPTM